LVPNLINMRILSLVLLFLVSTPLFSQKKNNSYKYTVDLTNVVNDRVYVELTPPAISEKDLTFYFPKVVPGTYAIADYGRYVTELTALDKKGKKLNVEKVDENTWRIKNAKNVAKITYWIDDTFDTTVTGPEIFWPAGTNIEESKNVIINTSGFFGYIDGHKEMPFEFNVVRAKEFYGSTGLIPSQTGASLSSLKLENISKDQNKVVDVYKTTDYDQLIDSPLMYSKPDTAVIKVGNTEVLIGSYSPNKKITANEIAESIREVLMAQKEFLGGTLPVDKYAFIFYFTDQPIMSYGALEHSYSSLYYMPEMGIDEMRQQLRDFAAHEFFHIVTPLTVHSEEIANFDFNEPKMSQHLWLYEGVTEYFAGNVQVKYGLIDIDQYIQMIQEKMFQADQFNGNLSFTDLSKYTLDKYHDQYQNVYLKGALIGLCLDIKLRKLSGGEKGLQDLVIDLSKKYGKEKAFKDDELFAEITKMTYPEIGEFLNKHVKGSEPLPLQEVFNDVGILYTPEEKFEDYSLGIGNEDLTVYQMNDKPKLQIATTENLNALGQDLGFKEGDVLLEMNGEAMPDLGPGFPPFLEQQMMSLPTRDSISYTVLRKDESGQEKEVELKAAVKKIELLRKHFMQPNQEATEAQIKLRDSWLQAK
jgi:predicted metalloprotease with PDZ domain